MKTFKEYLLEISDKTKLSYLKKSDELHRKHQQSGDKFRSDAYKSEKDGDDYSAEENYNISDGHYDKADKYSKKVKTGLKSIKKKSYTITGKQNEKDISIRVPAENVEDAKKIATDKKITAAKVKLNKSDVKDVSKKLAYLKKKAKKK